jgi:hypothetical protein
LGRIDAEFFVQCFHGSGLAECFDDFANHRLQW